MIAINGCGLIFAKSACPRVKVLEVVVEEKEVEPKERAGQVSNHIDHGNLLLALSIEGGASEASGGKGKKSGSGSAVKVNRLTQFLTC